MTESLSGRGLAKASRTFLVLCLGLLPQCTNRESCNAAGSGALSLDALGPRVFQLEAAVVDGDMHGTFASVFVQVLDPAAAASNPPAPAIHSVTSDVPSTLPRGIVHLSALATGSGTSPLRYVWIAPGGSLGGSLDGKDTWTACSQPGTYILEVTVTDGITWSSNSIAIPVTGPAATSGTGNHPPDILSLTASTVTVARGGTVPLTLRAARPDPLKPGRTSFGIPIQLA
ncbi:MAG TPA: hypothetical protein VKW04_01575 [Planctomycetota bacterium]|nr:hypothetical protein [Planctomycetota bacterium]